MKIILIIFVLFGFVYAEKSEKLFWDEVKNSADIELLKLYKQQYPHGIFERLADIKIKRLYKSNKISEIEDPNAIPLWIKGNVEYRLYGLGNANKHFKGKYYQENVARSRARKNLQYMYDDKKLSNELMNEYNEVLETKEYVDDDGRIYILVYIDNINIH
jgi:hypothetical protein